VGGWSRNRQTIGTMDTTVILSRTDGEGSQVMTSWIEILRCAQHDGNAQWQISKN
jgi:hypothetical protein